MSFSSDVSTVNWRSVDQPPGFLHENAKPPDAMRRFVATLSADSDRDLARLLASHLVERLKDTDGAVRSLDVGVTYAAITERGAGYCSDVVDAFTALALAAHLPVRQWAFTFDGFGGHGHVIAEVFDRGLGQWVALDVFNNVMPVQAVSGVPLSAVETRALLISDEKLVRFVPIGPGRLGFVKDERLRDYYRKGLDQWYFWNGNNVISRGETMAVRAAASIGEPLGELVVMARGQFPSIVPIPTSTNTSLVERMKRLQSILFIASGLAGVLIAVISVLVILLVRERRRLRTVGTVEQIGSF